MHSHISIRGSIVPLVCESIGQSVMLPWISMPMKAKVKNRLMQSRHHAIIPSTWGRIVGLMGLVHFRIYNMIDRLFSCLGFLALCQNLGVLSLCLCWEVTSLKKFMSLGLGESQSLLWYFFALSNPNGSNYMSVRIIFEFATRWAPPKFQREISYI